MRRRTSYLIIELCTLVLFCMVSVNSFASCATAPLEIYVHLDFPSTDDASILTNPITRDGCNYIIGQQQPNICWTPDEDDGIVKCTFIATRNADVGGGDNDAGFLVSHDYPALGCGTISGDFGSTSFCTYDGEYDESEHEQEIATGWHRADELSEDYVIPGVEPNDINNKDTYDDEGCPDGYEEIPDSEFLCIKEEKSGSYSSWFNPNTNTGPETDGDPTDEPDDEDGAGIDICIEHPDIEACQIITGSEYDLNSSDYEDFLGDDADVPDEQSNHVPTTLTTGTASCPFSSMEGDFDINVIDDSISVPYNFSSWCDWWEPVETFLSLLFRIIGFATVIGIWHRTESLAV